MTCSAQDFEHFRDLFSAFGPVSVRRMFGGAGIYTDGVMFAIWVDRAIYLKTDATTIPAFQRERCQPFAYEKKDGRRTVMSYWKLPDRLYDDPAGLATWAHAALGVARAASHKSSNRMTRRAKTRGAARASRT